MTKTRRRMAWTAALALAGAGIAAAQTGAGDRLGNRIREQVQRELASQETVTVTGTLALRDGQIALVDGDTVYYAPSLRLVTGFVDGLKEGASVTVEGYVFQEVWLSPTAVTVAGKRYDVAPRAPDAPDAPAAPPMPVIVAPFGGVSLGGRGLGGRVVDGRGFNGPCCW